MRFTYRSGCAGAPARRGLCLAELAVALVAGGAVVAASPSSFMEGVLGTAPSERAARVAAERAAHSTAAAVGVYCFWENGNWNGMGGFSSNIGTGQFDAETCDDFAVPPGLCLRVDTIDALFLTNSSPASRTAVLSIYTNCNGCPDDLVATSANPMVVNTGQFAPIDPSFELVMYTFDQFTYANSPSPAQNYLWLSGGQSYWLCVQHIGDGSWQDAGYWAHSDCFLGTVAKQHIPDMGMGPCFPVDQDTNPLGGKKDLAFRVCGDTFREWCNNGNFSTDLPPIQLNSATGQPQSADDCTFMNQLIKGTLAQIKIYVAANTLPTLTTVQIWTGDCEPESLYEEAIFTNPVIVNTGQVTSPGSLPIYKLIYCDLQQVLDPKQNYWLVVSVKLGAGFGKAGYWLFNENCKDPDCLIQGNEGVFRNPPHSTVWRKVSELFPGDEIPQRDFAFSLCIQPFQIVRDQAPDKKGAMESMDQLRSAILDFVGGRENGQGLDE